MNSKKTVTFLAALIVFGAGIPGNTQALVVNDVISIKKPVVGTQSTVRPLNFRTRKNLLKAQEIYEELVRQGVKNLVVPDYNKPETIEVYLTGFPEGIRAEKPEHTRATDPIAPKGYEKVNDEDISYDDLSDGQRLLLRQSVRTGHCWESLEANFPGFTALCEKLRKTQTIKNVRGIQNDLIKIKGKTRI